MGEQKGLKNKQDKIFRTKKTWHTHHFPRFLVWIFILLSFGFVSLFSFPLPLPYSIFLSLLVFSIFSVSFLFSLLSLSYWSTILKFFLFISKLHWRNSEFHYQKINRHGIKMKNYFWNIFFIKSSKK